MRLSGIFRRNASLAIPHCKSFAAIPSLSLGSLGQRTPWGGGKKRGVENLTNDTPPKKGVWTPPRTVRFPPPSGVSALFSCTKVHDRADQNHFWRCPKNSGRVRSLMRFPPPTRFAHPHITAPLGTRIAASNCHTNRSVKLPLFMGDRFLSSAGAEENCARPYEVARPQPSTG